MCQWIAGAIIGVVITFIVIAVLAERSYGAGHNHPPEVSQLHDQFYASWLRPDNRQEGRRWVSCCNKHDCFPAEIKRIGGTWFATSRWTQQVVPIPEHLFEHNQPDPRESPDGLNHACINPINNQVYCAVLGGGQ